MKWSDYDVLYQLAGCVRWALVMRRANDKVWMALPLDLTVDYSSMSCLKALDEIVGDKQHSFYPINESSTNAFLLHVSYLISSDIHGSLLADFERCKSQLPVKGGGDGLFIGSTIILDTLRELGDSDAIFVDGLPISNILEDGYTIVKCVENKDVHSRDKELCAQRSWLAERLGF